MLFNIACTMLGFAALLDGILLYTLLRETEPSKLRVLFAHMIAGTACWNMSVLGYLVTERDILVPLVYISAIYFIAARYVFVRAYTKTLTRSSVRWITAVSVLLGIAACIPGVLVRNPHLSETGYVVVENGVLTGVFTLFVLYATIHPIVLLYRASRTSTEARTIFIGLTLYAAVATVLSNLILPVLFKIYYLNTIGPAFSTFFTAFVFYAIFRYHFLNIRILLQHGLIFSILFGIAIGLYGSVMGLAVWVFADISPLEHYGIAATLMVVGATYLPPIERWLRSVTDPVFMQRMYNYQEVVRALSDIFAQRLSAENLRRTSLRLMKKTLHVRSIGLYPEGSRRLRRRCGGTMRPIRSLHGSHGVLVVCEKRSHDPFTQTDHELITFYATMLGIGLDKAHLLDHLEDEVAARTQEVTELRKAERARYAALAHEIKTPLTVLAGTYELLDKTNTITRNDMSMFGKSIEKTTQAVRDMLELSRIATAKHAYHTDIDISALLTAITEYVDTICAAEDVDFSASIEPGCFVQGDARDLEIMVNNLLSNAVRYTKTVSNPRINVRLTREHPQVILTVTDNGIGIEPDDLPHIFTNGRRGKNAAHIPGDGLGLAIVKSIADVHHATIETRSVVDSGTTIRVVFPSP